MLKTSLHLLLFGEKNHTPSPAFQVENSVYVVKHNVAFQEA